MNPPLKWPMPLPQDQDRATLIAECARVLRNCETEYTGKLADELEKREAE